MLHLASAVRRELRWSFTRPMVWLSGVAANLVLSLLWLLWEPLTGRPRTDWIIIVGTYFATFVLADVTTTNVLGPDADNVERLLDRGWSIQRLLLVKNAALLVIVGAPTLLATAILTETSSRHHSLSVTLPGVALPILTWLGVGNVVSVLLPVRTVPIRQRWRQRRDVRATLRWLFHLGLPYMLLYLVQPLGGLPRTVLHQVARASRTPDVRGLTYSATAVLIWLAGLLAASMVVRWRGLRIR